MIKRFKKNGLAILLLTSAFFGAEGQDNAQAVTVQGHEAVVTVTKTVSQTLSLAGNIPLVVYNDYGDVKVITSKGKSIRIKAFISASSEDAARAASLLKSIHIDFKKEADSVTCIAAIGAPVKIRAMNTPDTGKQQPITITILPAKWCSVKFEVYLPATQPLNIYSMFGNITMGDYAGPLTIRQRFGDFTAGNLTGPTKFDLSQGNVSVKHLKFGQMSAKTFDHVTIAGISGTLSGQFQFGRALNLNLKNLRGSDSIGLRANNVEQVNISGVTPITARYSLKLVFAKLQFDGADFANDKNIFSFREVNVDKRKQDAQRLDDSILKARPELKIMPADVTLSVDTVKSKKIKELKILSLAKFKKVHEYVGGPEGAKKKVNIDIDFGTLNLMP